MFLRLTVRRFSLIAAGFLLVPLVINAQQPPPPPLAAETEELTRGPIHEAFGKPIRFDPEPGAIVPKAPPAAVEEVPPDQKPEGDNVAWIPGYWAWDDDAKNFVWVSGFWRSLPPGRSWVPGYWTKADNGYQWVSGFWGAEKATEVEYLPEPPESLENGPSVEPTEGKMWVPGVWLWRETRYAWRPGYWAAVNPDWVWVPAQYVWTPNGFVFINGYWDYPLFSRGLLFAPVTFARLRPGLVYTPSIVLDVRYLVDALFVGPRYGHYFFGDYYDPRYIRGGYYPWFAYHNSRYGYVPSFAHMHYTLARSDPRWEDRLRAQYYNRRDHEAARPPHTYRAYSEWARKTAGAGHEVQPLARPLREIQTTKGFPTRMERVPEKQTQIIRNQIKQVNEFRERRQKGELDGAKALHHVGKVEPKGGKLPKTPPITQRHEPGRVKLPESPHLGPPAGTTIHHAKPLPERPQVPNINPKVNPPAVRGGGHKLPTPEDIIRQHGPKQPMPKGKGNPPPKKKGKGDF